MSRDRINVRTLLPTQFNPPAGCSYGEVIASWREAQQIVTCEHQHEVVAPTRAKCLALLQSELLSDMEAVEAVRKILKQHGW